MADTKETKEVSELEAVKAELAQTKANYTTLVRAFETLLKEYNDLHVNCLFTAANNSK